MEYNKNENAYLKNNEKNIYDNLYKIYFFIQGIDNPALLKEYEDKVYTIDNEKISEIERIELAIYLVEKRALELKYDHLMEEINDIKEKINTNSQKLNSLKKRITLLQAELGLETSFYTSVKEVFEEKYGTNEKFNQYIKKN